MATLDDIACKLAEDTMALMQETGNDRLYFEVAEVLGASSQTLEEAFLTEMRVRLAGLSARKFLDRKIAEARRKSPPGPAASPPAKASAPARQARPRSSS